MDPFCIRTVDFAGHQLVERCINTVAGIEKSGTSNRRWINISGRPNAELLARLQTAFALDERAFDDLGDPNLTTKLEEHDHYRVLVLQTINIDSREELNVESLIACFGVSFVITFLPESCFQFVKTLFVTNYKSKSTLGIICALVSHVILQRHFPMLKGIDDAVDLIEDQFETGSDAGAGRRIYEVKARLRALHGVTHPLRDCINRLKFLAQKDLKQRFSELLEQFVHLSSEIRTARDTCTDLSRLIRDASADRANEAMKVLAIITSLLGGPSIVGTIYGMNFSIPELSWRHGYFYALGLMVSIDLVIVIYLAYAGVIRWPGQLLGMLRRTNDLALPAVDPLPCATSERSCL